ncbi:DNA polymerase III subunit beta [Undibacterium sp. RTI2.1]|uniref:DNA polymerase III subunit beta n=1 Tax=unclassified Undibacterium TaxID=2630295 RepID=UPI002AB55A2F|nr:MULTISPECIES: DNA polymerase III subunit beta [unclassified Undibacterium]MDY7539654.1 DNA polymerase III subunit beta [Undibacterium sp. 5I1]MEB0032780.1 DNA polymerase III subunit beta [Undibacterium sp. RTI2.1]MEB0118749.1 DNA polymerase III subunit beta [Undibacterium sp. RTI2.2]MEB0232233.1 DNA polymerase III subunit beta [Undibacterium sp. 10I3]MEB0257430.1 DNA polymerase III subunit beta [Undibacterium sp. 5I1]
MQLVKTHRDTILRPLQIVSGIVERRHTLPILANILIRKDGEKVSFLSTDIEVQITTRADIGSGGESIATTVAARKLLDILRALPDDNDIVLKLDNKKMTVQSGKSRFSLQTLAAEEFPTVAQAEHFNASVSLPQKTLKHLFNMVHFSMAQQDIRYYLNGLLLVVDGKNVIAVATDGHRLAYCQVEVEQEFPRQEVIIPRKTIIELQRLLEDKDDLVQLDIANNQVKLTFADIELISKLVEGKFPDFNRVIPKGYKNNFTLGREQLLRSLQRAAIMTSDKFKGVRCVVTPGSMQILSTNADQEEAVEEIEIDYGGDSVDIGFNVTYLLDVLNNLKVDQINLAFGDSNSSALITIPDNADFKYVVMPMRI